MRNLAAALDTANYTVQAVPTTEKVVKGILNSKNPADDLKFTSKVPSAGMLSHLFLKITNKVIKGNDLELFMV